MLLRGAVLTLLRPTSAWVQDKENAYLHNHLSFTILYHKVGQPSFICACPPYLLGLRVAHLHRRN